MNLISAPESGNKACQLLRTTPRLTSSPDETQQNHQNKRGRRALARTGLHAARLLVDGEWRARGSTWTGLTVRHRPVPTLLTLTFGHGEMYAKRASSRARMTPCKGLLPASDCAPTRPAPPRPAPPREWGLPGAAGSDWLPHSYNPLPLPGT